MKLEKFDYIEAIKFLKEQNKTYRSCLDEYFIEYLKEYNVGKLYEQISLKITSNNDYLIALVTIEKKNGKKKLNFFGEPIFIITNEINKNLIKEFLLYMKNFTFINKIDDVSFILSFENQFNIKNFNNLPDYVDKITYENLIDTTKTLHTIQKDFKGSLRTTLNKKYDELNYKIIDASNYNGEIFKMMLLHQEVSKKKTRSEKTWLINEKMILEKKGFLVEINFNNTTISYSFFFINEISCYFSSCTYREYFSQFGNLTHQSIFEAIKYLKLKGNKFFTLGDTKYLYSKKEISQKEKNIALFKNSFGGQKILNFYLNSFDENFLNLF